MKNLKTKSILACAVLASVLGVGSVFAEGNAISLTDFIVYGAKGEHFNTPTDVGVDSLAIGNFASADGASSNAIGNNAEADHEKSNAMGYFAIANAAYSNAIGANASAQKAYSVALGAWSIADRDLSSREGVYELSVGGNNVSRVITHVADGTDDHDAATYGQVKDAVKGLNYDSNTKKISFTTVGNGTTQYLDLSGLGIGSPNYVAATQYDGFNNPASAMEKQADGGGGATALGYNAKADAAFATALGWGAQATSLDAIAIGKGSSATGKYALAAGDESKAEGEQSTALGYKNEAKSDSSTAVGYFNVVNRTKGAAFGTNNKVAGLTGIALGSMNEVSGDYAITLGSNSKAQKDYSVAMGSYAIANGVESMALGRDSQTGASAVGAMAFGSSARATGVGALAVGSFSESAKRDYAVKYCKETMKRVVQFDPQIEVEPWEKALQLMAEEKGLENCLAMNTQNFIDSINEKLVGGYYFDNYVIDAIAGENGFVGTTASGVNAISIGASTKPQGNMTSGDNSIAIGTDARANKNGSIALGAWSVASRDLSSRATDNDVVYELSVGGGKDTNDKTVYRVITNVADGTDAHDAVNLKQMQDAITLATGSMGGGTGGSGTAPDYIAAGPKDDPVPSATAYGTGSIALGYGAKVIGTSGTTDHSLAVGYNAQVTSASAIAMGDDALAEGLRSVAIGRNAKTTANHSVALGYNSVASEEYTVSVGSSGAERRIVNVAAGTADTDAVNKGQLDAAVAGITGGEGGTPDFIAYKKPNKSDLFTSPTAEGSDSFAVGHKAIALGASSNAIGYEAVAVNVSSNAIGYNARAQGNSTNAIGDRAWAKTAGSVALGAWSVAERTGLGEGIYELSVGGGTDTNYKTVYRVITHVADGTDDHDAATVGQVKAAIAEISGGGSVDAYTKAETNTLLDVKANTADVYAKTETYSKTEVDTELAKKANSADVYTKTEADTTFTTKSYVDNAIEAISGGIVSPDDKKAAYGTNNEVAKEATAIGHGNKVTGENSVAVGAGHQIAGKNSGAFGDPTYIDADNSYAIGNSNIIKDTAEGSFVMGNNVTVTSQNAVVLGNESADGGPNTVSVGAPDAERKIVNVADGENAHDAATYGQLERTAGQLSSQIDRMGTRISKVGAGAAALAAMHPVYDPESKLTFSAGVGNYKSETAAAVGLFYRFDDRVMLNFGASVGNDNDMYNMGLNFALGRHTPKGLPTKQVMYQQLVSLQTLLNEQKAENAAMHNENSTMRELLLKQSAENAAIKEQIDAQKAQHDAQIAQLLAMIEELKNR